MRGSNDGFVQLVLQGYIEGKKEAGGPRRILGDDDKKWSKFRTMVITKRLSKNKPSWQRMVTNFDLEDVVMIALAGRR